MPKLAVALRHGKAKAVGKNLPLGKAVAAGKKSTAPSKKSPPIRGVNLNSQAGPKVKDDTGKAQALFTPEPRTVLERILPPAVKHEHGDKGVSQKCDAVASQYQASTA